MSKLFFAFCIFLSGCSYHTHYVSPTREVYPPLSASGVAISTQKKIATPHKVLGRVAVVTSGGGDAALEHLREEAARIGGNLIIDLRVEKASTGVAVSGLAVLLHVD
jgi:hypothetical protein